MFFEREQAIEGMLCGLLARAPVALLGRTGTGRGALVRALRDRIEGARLFQRRLSRGTGIDEIVGPLSLDAYARGELIRNLDGRLLDAEFAYLSQADEVRGPVLEPLLSLIDHGSWEGREAPLRLLVLGAEELGADSGRSGLWDRVPLRYLVEPIQIEASFVKMLASGASARGQVLATELDDARTHTARGAIPGALLRSVAQIRSTVLAKGIEVSDRRWRRSLDLLRARAYLEGRSRCDMADLKLFEHICWNEPGEIAEVAEAVRRVSRDEEETH